MHCYYHFAESNCDYIFTITSEFYTTFFNVFIILVIIILVLLKELFNISHKAGLVVMNFLSFCLFRKVCIPPLFLKQLFVCLFFVFLPFLGPLPWHMEVPRLGD